MIKKLRSRRTAILTLVLAAVLFTAGAGQAVALEGAHDRDFGPSVMINLFDRIGDFVSGLAAEVTEIFSKSGASPGQDG